MADSEEIGFIAGRSQRNAQRALDAADAVHIAQWRVRAVSDGYHAPQPVVDEYQRVLEEEIAADAEAQAAAQAELEKQEAAEAEFQAKADEARAAADAPAGEGTAPESDDLPADNEDWTHKRLDDFAGEHKIELAKNLNKPDKVAAILAALNEKE